MGRVRERGRLDRVIQKRDQLVCTFRGHFFVIIAAEERTAVDGVVLLEEFINTDELVRRFLVGGRKNVQPGFGSRCKLSPKHGTGHTCRQSPTVRPFHGYGLSLSRKIPLHRWRDVRRPSSFQRTSSLSDEPLDEASVC